MIREISRIFCQIRQARPASSIYMKFQSCVQAVIVIFSPARKTRTQEERSDHG